MTDRIGQYQPQVPGAEFGLGVRWSLVLTSVGVPEQFLGNPPVVVFSLGLGGVPGESPVAGQLGGTLLCAGPLTHLTLRVPVCVPGVYHLPDLQLRVQLGPQGKPVVGRKSRGGQPPEREEWTSRMHVTLRFDVTANLCLRRLRDPARDYCSLVDVALYQILAVMITTT